jgi:soluble lytic murein transglycosylase-like protein
MRSWAWYLVCIVATAQAGEFVPREAVRYQRDVIRNARVVWGLDAPVPVFAAQIHQESRWRSDARSPYASGLAQFTPATAGWIADAFPGELRDAQPLNPAWAIRALVRYDRYLWDRVSGATVCDRWAFTLSGYNGGPGWVPRDRKLAAQGGADPQRWFGHVELYNAGRREDFFRENRGYPRRILIVLQPLYTGWGTTVVECVLV